MKSNRINGSASAAQVALNLFNQAPAAVKPKPKPKPNPATAPAAEQNAFRVVYPMINDVAHMMMMDNYRRFVFRYNTATHKENADIHNYNENVKLYLKHKATEMQLTYARQFPLLNADLNTRQYNAEAQRINDQHGFIIKKKPVHILKYATELFFTNFLHVYNRQLCEVNKEYMRLKAHEPKPIRKLKLNARFITQLRRAEGVCSLNVCTKTVRNHRQHLEQAGVLVNSTFHGHRAPVEVEINPEILVIFDLRTNRIARPENQSPSLPEGKTLPDNDEITGAFKEEYKEEIGPEAPLVDKESAEPTGFFHYRGSFYRNTAGKVENSPVGGAAGTTNIEKSLGEKMRERILHPQEFAEALAAGEYNNYIPLDVGLMRRVAYEGMLSSDEYHELFIQELFKQAAKIWKHSTPYVGSWKNAYNHWMKHKFRHFNGSAFNPTNVFTYLEEYRWRLEQARRWYLRGNVSVKPLFPSDYFDITRKTTREIGFEGTLAMWKRKLKDDEKRPLKERKLQRDAERRVQRNSDNDRFKREMNRFLKGKIDIPHLSLWVRNNLPAEFYQNLPREIDKRLAEIAKGAS